MTGLLFLLLITLLSFADAKLLKSHTKMPSCGGCYSGINGIYYTCSDCSISSYNGNCLCGDGSPCTPCSPSSKDKQGITGKSSWNKLRPEQQILDSPFAFGAKVAPPTPVGPIAQQVAHNKLHDSSSAGYSGVVNVSMTAFDGIYYHYIVLLESDQKATCGDIRGHNGNPSASPPTGLFWSTPLCGLFNGDFLSFNFGAVLLLPQNNIRAFDWLPLTFQVNDQNTYNLTIQGYSYDTTRGQYLNLVGQFNNCQGYYWNVNSYMGFNWFLCYQ